MFSFPLTIHEGDFAGQFNAPAVTSIPLSPADDVGAVILTTADGPRPPGLYLFDGRNYRYCIPDLEISKAIIHGYTINLYYGLLANVTVDADEVFKNGILFQSSTLVPGSIYGALKYNGGGGGGAVSSINNATGSIVISGASGIDVTTSGSSIEMSPGILDEGEF